MPARATAEGFWDRACPEPNSGCWLYDFRPHYRTGYVQLKFHQRMIDAHRLAWELAVGPIPAGLSVLHRCDVRICVRPSHLFLGTQADNMRDMAAKGRGCPGEKNGFSRVTESQVLAIRTLWAGGRLSQRAIGERFGISQNNVSHICRRQTWTHITDDRREERG